MFYSGIDQHKRFSYITTVNDDGIIIKQAEIKNNDFDILNYFSPFGKEHLATVETTGGWYWLNDLLFSNGINLKLAHAIIAKEIARIAFYVLKYKSDFNNHFKGIDLENKKSFQCPPITSPDV